MSDYNKAIDQLKQCKDLYLNKNTALATCGKYSSTPNANRYPIYSVIPLVEDIMKYITSESKKATDNSNSAEPDSNPDMKCALNWCKVLFTAPVYDNYPYFRPEKVTNEYYAKFLQPLKFDSKTITDQSLKSVAYKLQQFLYSQMKPWDREWLNRWTYGSSHLLLVRYDTKLNAYTITFEDTILGPVKSLFQAAKIPISFDSIPQPAQINGFQEEFMPGFIVKKDCKCIFFIMKTKEHSLGFVRDGNIIPYDKMKTNKKEFDRVFAQALWYLVHLKLDTCMISDSQTSIIIQLNFDLQNSGIEENSQQNGINTVKSEPKNSTKTNSTRSTRNTNCHSIPINTKSTNKTNTVPIKSKAFHYSSTSPSVIGVLAIVCYQQYLRTNEQITRSEKASETLKEMLSFDTPSLCKEAKKFGEKDHDKMHVSVGCNMDKFEVLQRQISKSAMVFSIDRQDFKMMFPSIKLNNASKAQRLVLKMYDFRHLELHYKKEKFHYWEVEMDNFSDYIHQCLLKEIECYKKISEYNSKLSAAKQIQVPMVHNYGSLIKTDHKINLPLFGFFILLDYIGEELGTLSQVQYKDAVTQLRNMGSLGIKLDFSKASVRPNGTRVSFIDFSRSEVSDVKYENKEFIEKLGEFADVKSEFIVVKDE